MPTRIGSPGAGRWWRWCRREIARDNAADHVAVNLLQGAVIAALIGKKKRMAIADSLDQVAGECSAVDVEAQLAQFLLIGSATNRNFALIFVDDGQFGETGGKPCISMVWIECKRLRDVGGAFLVAADFQQAAAALIPGLDIARD